MSLEREVEERLVVALALVEEAGRLALAHFRQPIAVENKLGPGAFDPVTVAESGTPSEKGGASDGPYMKLVK